MARTAREDPGALMKPYLAEMERLYIEDLPFAMLADAMEAVGSRAAREFAAG